MNRAEAGRLGGKAKVRKGFATMTPEQMAEVVAKSKATRARKAALADTNKKGRW